MRVCHVISTRAGLGGAERVLAGVVAGLSDLGWEQLVLNPFADPIGSRLASLSRPGVEVRLLPAARMDELPRLRAQLRDRIADFGPDLTHAHLFHAMVAVASLPSAGLGRRVVTHHHGASKRFHARRMQSLLDRIAVRRFDRIIAVSASVAEYLGEAYGLPEEAIRIIRNGWAGEPRDWVGSERSNTIVTVANPRREKGLDLLLEAMTIVCAEIATAELVIIGDGPGSFDLATQRDSMGLGTKVRFVGWQEDVWAYLANAEIFALTSRHETAGIAVMEGMAASLPIVATSVGGLGELVRHEQDGILVPPGNVDGIAQALMDLLRSPDRARRFGRAGHRRSVEWRLERTVAEYIDLYREVIRN